MDFFVLIWLLESSFRGNSNSNRTLAQRVLIEVPFAIAVEEGTIRRGLSIALLRILFAVAAPADCLSSPWHIS